MIEHVGLQAIPEGYAKNTDEYLCYLGVHNLFTHFHCARGGCACAQAEVRIHLHLCLEDFSDLLQGQWSRAI